MYQYFLIAKVHSAFGNDGFVRIISFSDFPERFYSLKKVYIDFFDQKKEFFVEKVKKKKNFFILKFKNFDNVEDIKVLINKEIFVSDSDAVKLPNEFSFVHDLVGSSVYQNDVLIGVLKDVLSLSANDVYVIDNKGEELLIPAVKSFVERIDSKNKILILKPDVNLYDED